MRKLGFADIPQDADRVRLAPEFGQRFFITVDTEEEFDWEKPLQRSGHSLESVPALVKFQQFCESFDIQPIYLVDYPIINFQPAAEILASFVASGKAAVGIQLHPWVSPPFDEEVNPFNSFSGNLPKELEREKLFRLRDAITKAVGVPPIIYRAGRYGIGPNTDEILKEAGVAIDTSVRAKFDYSAGHGPDFRKHPLTPYWLDKTRGLMELPLTTVFWGVMRRQGDMIYPLLWRMPSMRGLLSRMGLLERIALTPEGISLEEAIKGIDIALDDGLPLLNFSFHSPSLRAGYTPYVRDDDDLDGFYDWWRRVFAYLELRGVKPASLDEFMAAVQV